MKPTKKPAADKPKRGRPWPDGPRGRKRPLLASSSVAQDTADGIQSEMDAQGKPRGHIIDAMWAAYTFAARSKISQLESNIAKP